MHGILLGVRQPAGQWCRVLDRAYGDLTIRVRSVVPSEGPACTETVELAGPDVPKALGHLRRLANVSRLQVLDEDKRHALVRFQVDGCPVLSAVRAGGVPPELPFRCSDGEDRLLFLGEADELAGVLHELRRRGLEERVVYAGPWSRGVDSLTPHQRDVLATALEAGYYAHPRRISMTRLAERLGVSKSTMSETLMIIETRLVEEHMSGAGGDGWHPAGGHPKAREALTTA